MADYETPPPTSISASSQDLFLEIQSAPLAILCGRNNSGKSFVLRKLLEKLGRQASYLGPARYQNFNVLAPYGPQKNRKNHKWQRLLKHLQNSKQNIDNSPLNLQQAIAELSDVQRGKLFEVIDDLLGARTEIRHTVPGNSMSQKYVNVDGYNLSYTSSGFRLIATLLTSLLDEDYTHFLIDEPELGLSPEVQGIFSEWLLDPDERRENLGHVGSVVMATHSPIFLDRKVIGNNYLVEREGTEISLTKLRTVQDLNRLQFNLLGNRFETLFLPSALVLVEGSTDHAYVSRLLNLQHPEASVSVMRASGDGRMREILAVAKQMLGDISKSPYANRIFVVLDSKHGQGLTDFLVKQGVQPEHVVVWDANGIEFLYPRRVLEKKFGSFGELRITGDRVEANGVVVTKKELSDFVVNNLQPNDDLPSELREKLTDPLGDLLY